MRFHLHLSDPIYFYLCSLFLKRTMSLLTQTQISGLKQLLSKRSRIVLTTHTNPDGDAIGSTMAMFHYLRIKGHEVTAMVPNSFPGFLGWTPEVEKMLVYTNQPKDCQQALQEAELIFCLDYNGLSRTGVLTEFIKKSEAPRILIDHHIEPETESFDYCFCTVNTSSTAELVYDFMELVGDNVLLNREIAECLYAGIVTDTGSFSFAANSERTYHVMARLIRSGLDALKIHRLIYDTFSENRLRLLGHAINNRMIVWDDLHTALIYFDKGDLKQFDYQVGDAEGIVNFPLSMEKINLSILLTERDKKVRISFRSKGGFSVNLLARKHFEGGGHQNAAGGNFYESVPDTIRAVKKILGAYKEELNFKTGY
ncbi:MAG: bifunctional oligoribonuclease/PAP phosphatase NrnA [Bacteroidales bacterium]|nr:bifunctional oligoribonuclease/PAP phosphatase NrnA [Bacteroidales bacterium]